MTNRTTQRDWTPPDWQDEEDAVARAESDLLDALQGEQSLIPPTFGPMTLPFNVPVPPMALSGAALINALMRERGRS